MGNCNTNTANRKVVVCTIQAGMEPKAVIEARNSKETRKEIRHTETTPTKETFVPVVPNNFLCSIYLCFVSAMK